MPGRGRHGQGRLYDRLGPARPQLHQGRQGRLLRHRRAHGRLRGAAVDWAAIGHGALDLLGFLPGLGAAADVANGLWYMAEGNYVDAGMSFLSAIPGVGDAAGVGKIGLKTGLKAVDAAGAVSQAKRIELNLSIDVPTPSSQAVATKVDPHHGNSKLSTRTQHGYVIYRKGSDGKAEVAKVGISGQALNKNGTSPRANRQVNSFNRDEDGYEYFAVIEESNILGRQAALEWEKDMAAKLKSAGAQMPKHVRP